MKRLVVSATCLGWAVVLSGCIANEKTFQATEGQRRQTENGSAITGGSDGSRSPTAGRTGPLPNGGAGSCVEAYSPSAVAERAFAFDGVVIDIGPSTTDRGDDTDLDLPGVTIEVRTWFAGGAADTVTVDMQPPHPSSAGESGDEVAYGVGSRLLVSGESRWGGSPLEKAIAWGCGFSRYYDPVTAQSWSRATGGDREWRWVGLRDVEVQAPALWHFDYEAVRPDCIDVGDGADRWAQDVPEAPYVTVGTPDRAVPAIGCLRKHRSGDPGPAFGELPFPLWQPHVKLEHARPDLEDPARTDGHWEYRDWQLTRATIGHVQVTVLAPPERPGLGRRVLRSAQQVGTTSLGCDSSSPVQAERFARPTGAPIPAARDVEAVAVCEYSRNPGGSGLEGSRRLTGHEARDLVEAIRQAPPYGGPDRPQACVRDMYGDRAIALRFFGSREKATKPLAEAYVYYDWCFGNGIFDSRGVRKLTRADCAPLFAEAPTILWSGQQPVVQVCGPMGSR